MLSFLVLILVISSLVWIEFKSANNFSLLFGDKLVALIVSRVWSWTVFNSIASFLICSTCSLVGVGLVLSNLLCKVVREPSGRLLIAFWASVCAWAYSASSTSCLWACCILVRTSATFSLVVALFK
ncbi:hypothetical protein NWE59_06320 [Mycoplasmopsis felis]|uniref:hypothetical protein n=1 Tax=Mycoplasmopsis felis TaxID=33923 RepID=UPI0021AE44E4|nr:hypothetical protein [Mycoplasmopsis felis]UWV78457.1 hypothetical protein NWE59_06320 [Mycoplasmopsis felis]